VSERELEFGEYHRLYFETLEKMEKMLQRRFMETENIAEATKLKESRTFTVLARKFTVLARKCKLTIRFRFQFRTTGSFPLLFPMYSILYIRISQQPMTAAAATHRH